MSEYNEDEREVVVRKSVHDVFAVKVRLLTLYKTLEGTNKQIDDAFKEIDQYAFHRLDIDHNTKASGENLIEKSIDQRCWRYIIGLYHLEKFMLCTEYKKMMGQIESFDFPVFTVESAEGWLSSLKHLVYESVQKLIEDVFRRITDETYWVGGWNGQKKKRNNNGIDKFFIITTNDIRAIDWYSSEPTITDDLEKACYIIDGKRLPDVTLKATLYKEKRVTGENEYFAVTICKNGNTHYRWKKDEIRERLNLYGSKRGVIGDSAKIKVFDAKW